MQLPRHTLTSRAPRPAFASASFAYAGKGEDAGVVAGCATDEGFAVVHVPSLEVAIRRSFAPPCGLAHAVPLGDTSLIALVGGGEAPLFSPTQVVLWDDAYVPPARPAATTLFSLDDDGVHTSPALPATYGTPGMPVCQLEMHAPVCGVHAIAPDAAHIYLAVVLPTHALLLELTMHDTWTVKRRLRLDTAREARDVCALQYSPSAHAVLLAVPGRTLGHVQLAQVPLDDASVAATTIFIASQSPVAALTLWHGGLLATASERGTLVRVWRIVNSPPHAAHAAPRTAIQVHLVRELRRGQDPADTHGLAFAPDAAWLASVSDKGTVHFFRCDPSAPPRTAAERSAAKFYLPLQVFPGGEQGADTDVQEGAWARTAARLAAVSRGTAPRQERASLVWQDTTLYVLTTSGACYGIVPDDGAPASVQNAPPSMQHLQHQCTLTHLALLAWDEDAWV